MNKTKILCFSTFNSSWKINFQCHSGESIRNHCTSMVANQNWFPIMTQSLVYYHIIVPQRRKPHCHYRSTRTSHIHCSPNSNFCSYIYQESNGKLRPSGAYYGHYLSLVERHNKSRCERVLRQCWKRGTNPLVTDVKNVWDFLHMYKQGCRYSGICATASALSSAVTIPGYKRMSNHLFISRYVKGIYNKHPLVNIWNMNKLLA